MGSFSMLAMTASTCLTCLSFTEWLTDWQMIFRISSSLTPLKSPSFSFFLSESFFFGGCYDLNDGWEWWLPHKHGQVQNATGATQYLDSQPWPLSPSSGKFEDIHLNPTTCHLQLFSGNLRIQAEMWIMISQRCIIWITPFTPLISHVPSRWTASATPPTERASCPSCSTASASIPLWCTGASERRTGRTWPLKISGDFTAGWESNEGVAMSTSMYWQTFLPVKDLHSSTQYFDWIVQKSCYSPINLSLGLIMGRCPF